MNYRAIWYESHSWASADPKGEVLSSDAEGFDELRQHIFEAPDDQTALVSVHNYINQWQSHDLDFTLYRQSRGGWTKI